MASRTKPRDLRRGGPKRPWAPIHRPPKARLYISSSSEPRSKDIAKGNTDVMKLRGGRVVSKGFAQPKPRTQRVAKADPANPNHSEVSNIDSSSDPEPSPRALRSAASLGQPTADPISNLPPAIQRKLDSGARFKPRLINPMLTPDTNTPSQSDGRVLRSGRRLALPPTPTATGKRKREDEAEPSVTPFKRRSKAPKPKPVLVECSICAESKYSPPNFPQPNAFSNCTHELKACRHCIARHVIFELESKASWDRVTCLECRAPLLQKEVQAVITRMSARHCNVILKRKELEMNPNFRSCLSVSCSFGQVHRPGNKDNQVVTCTSCKAKSCFQHKIPWHADYTCEAYSNTPQAAITRTNEDRIRKETKKCPGEGCFWRIEKDGGCNHVFCTRCQKSFNWSDVKFDEEA
ncbi:MAG: hypothetical protein M1812_006130 [Candelaria pacifica]|nr:MAG: hypothetical protein M1812_006130 [Candelaria pacifica]